MGQDMENQRQRTGLDRIASKSLGVTVVGATLLVAGIAVVGLCIGLGIALPKDNDSSDNTQHSHPHKGGLTNLNEEAFARLSEQEGMNSPLLDQDQDGSNSPGEIFYGSNRVFCEAQHGTETSKDLFNCLDMDGSGSLSLQECFPYNEEFEKPTKNCETDEETGDEWCESKCDAAAHTAADGTQIISYCGYDENTETDLNGNPCPVMARRKMSENCKIWKPHVRGYDQDNIKTVFADQEANPASSWAKANTKCQAAYKDRVAVFRRDGGDDAGPDGRRLQSNHQAGGWSNSGISWKDDRILCNNIVKKSKVTAYGAAKSDAELKKSAADGGNPDVEDDGTGGNNCQFFAFRASKSKQTTMQPTTPGDPRLTGHCEANPCQGLGDGRCTPEITGGRCVWYQKEDTWNPWGQTGCYTSPCNNPTPNKPSACQLRPFRLADSNTVQGSCSPANSVGPGTIVMKNGKPSAQVSFTKEVDGVEVKVDKRCNRFTCEWCRGSAFLGCQNAHPYGWYTARMNDLGGKATAKSVGCRAMWNKDKGQWEICDKEAFRKNPNACTGWRRELCSGTPSASCNCQNPFCSVESLVKKSFYTDNQMSVPKNWVGLTEKYAQEMLITKTQEGDDAERKITCTGLENIGRGLGGKFTSGDDFNWKGKSNFNL